MQITDGYVYRQTFANRYNNDITITTGRGMPNDNIRSLVIRIDNK